MPGALGRDVWDGALALDLAPHGVGVIGAVGHHQGRRCQTAQQCCGGTAIRRLTTGLQERQRSFLDIARGVILVVRPPRLMPRAWALKPPFHRLHSGVL